MTTTTPVRRTGHQRHPSLSRHRHLSRFCERHLGWHIHVRGQTADIPGDTSRAGPTATVTVRAAHSHLVGGYTRCDKQLPGDHVGCTDMPEWQEMTGGKSA